MARALGTIPKGLGDRRLANMIYRRRYAGRGFKRAATVGGAWFELHLDEWPEAQAYLLGRYDPDTVEYVIRRLPPGGVFIDGGAHVGLISFQVAVRRPDARIYAFEPHPRVIPHHRRNAELNPGAARVELIEAAVSDSHDPLPFDLDGQSAAGDVNGFVPRTRLDDFLGQAGIERVDVLKLDVERHELFALRGATRALHSGRIGAVTMETMHGSNAAVQLLEEFGYCEVPLPDLRPRLLRRVRTRRSENAAFEPRR